jgi:hypothetical protein
MTSRQKGAWKARAGHATGLQRHDDAQEREADRMRVEEDGDEVAPLLSTDP